MRDRLFFLVMFVAAVTLVVLLARAAPYPPTCEAWGESPVNGVCTPWPSIP